MQVHVGTCGVHVDLVSAQHVICMFSLVVSILPRMLSHAFLLRIHLF